MRTHKKKTKTKSASPKVRRCTIQPQYRENRWSRKIVPEIRISGNWLQQLGFNPLQKVSITTKEKMLIIRVDEVA